MFEPGENNVALLAETPRRAHLDGITLRQVAATETTALHAPRSVGLNRRHPRGCCYLFGAQVGGGRKHPDGRYGIARR